MADSSVRYGVWVKGRRAGTLHQFGDHSRFILDAEYREDPDRPVLGLIFEERPNAVHAATLRLPPWFSNLLPEGRLRDWIADERAVSRQREMQLLAQVGHDLPGAVRVIPEGEAPAPAVLESDADTYPIDEGRPYESPELRFSLAGIAMKFSMVKNKDRLTLPAHGMGGDWIVKLPDNRFRDVPRNEYAMMSLARAAGIDIPEVLLVPRENLDSRLPASVWPNGEGWAYAVKRFDRGEGRSLIHMEDLAQVRNFYPDKKYLGTYETIASLVYRKRDRSALEEFARRLAFCVLISNGDAHLKNWSLIYINPRVPTLSPAYDLVCTGAYSVSDRPEDLGLKFGGTRLFHEITVGTFKRLQQRLGVSGVNLEETVVSVIENTRNSWPEFAKLLTGNQQLQDAIDQSIRARSRTLLKRR